MALDSGSKVIVRQRSVNMRLLPIAASISTIPRCLKEKLIVISAFRFHGSHPRNVDYLRNAAFSVSTFGIVQFRGKIAAHLRNKFDRAKSDFPSGHDARVRNVAFMFTKFCFLCL